MKAVQVAPTFLCLFEEEITKNETQMKMFFSKCKDLILKKYIG